MVNWYDPVINSISIAESEILISVDVENNTKLVKANVRLEVTEMQPSNSLTKNCTIGIFDHRTIIWVVVPCDQPILASIVCQKETAIKYIPFSFAFNPLNKSCDEGWFLIEGTQKCFTVFGLEKSISFSQANYICWQQKSSVLSVDIEFNTHSPIDAKKIMNKIHFYQMKYNQKETFISTEALANAWRISNVIFGGLINQYPARNILLRILPMALALAPSIKIFTRIGSHCGIVQYLINFEVGLYQPHLDDKYLNGFGGKYRDCDTLVDVDALVCEKHSNSLSPKACTNPFFECEDKTCILFIYKCDYVDDCFDKSDERECDIETLLSDDFGFNISINVPCQLNNNCFVDTSTIYVHNICDGVYLPDVLINEAHFCHTRILEQIKLSSLTTTAGHFIDIMNIPDMDIFQYYSRERNLFVKDSLSSFTTPQNVNPHVYEPRTVLCSRSGQGVAMHQRCNIGLHSTPCNFGFTKQICEHILCPGMYKCRDYYCIPVSAVCDGQADCLYGDDETFCNLYYCPGFLKCRGENRCVSFEEVCDGNVACLHSPDDELNCPTCPEGCVCDGYMMTCDVVNTWGERSRVSYSKGLVLSGVHTYFHIHNYSLHNLVYISMYACSLQNITLNSNLYNEDNQLLFANFSTNKLAYFHFFAHRFFSGILALDLNLNLITYITDKDVQLEYLTVLYISNNPIKVIQMHKTMFNVVLIEMKYIYYDGYLLLDISPVCNITVSDFTICCILSSHIKCTRVSDSGNCWGLFQNMYMKYFFYIIIMTCLLITSIMIFKIIYDKPWNTSQKKYYFISKFNYIIADIFGVVYYLALFAVDIRNLNSILWRKSILCILLRTVISITLQISLIFKTLSFIIVALKIRYPFRHQLRWLKYISVILPLIWLCVSLFEIYHVSPEIVHGETYLDTFCTCFDCLKHFQTFASILGSTNTVCIFVFIITELTTYFHLKKKLKLQKSISSTKAMPVGRVVLKMGRPFMTELILRIIILISYTFKYFNLHYSVKLCFLVVLYIVPWNIIVSNIINMI